MVSEMGRPPACVFSRGWAQGSGERPCLVLMRTKFLESVLAQETGERLCLVIRMGYW